MRFHAIQELRIEVQICHLGSRLHMLAALVAAAAFLLFGGNPLPFALPMTRPKGYRSTPRKETAAQEAERRANNADLLSQHRKAESVKRRRDGTHADYRDHQVLSQQRRESGELHEARDQQQRAKQRRSDGTHADFARARC